MAEMTHEHSHDEIHLPGPSWWPLILGGGLLVLAFGLAIKDLRLIVAPAGVLLLAIGMGGWLMSNIRERMHAPLFAGDAKMAMWMFLGSEVLFFTGLISVFLLIRARSPEDVGHVLNIPVTAINTFVLLTSSLTAVLAHDAAVHNKKGKLNLMLALTAIIGSAFVGVQAYEYAQLFEHGLTLGSSAYGTAFFTLTGFHGLHVVVGVIWCLAVLSRAMRGGFDEKHYGGVEIFGLYWHFVDVVWILLFTLIYLMQ